MTTRIFETVVYCGRTKVFRILNLNTGTVYTNEYESEPAALAAIEDGVTRNGYVVTRVNLRDVHALVADHQEES